MNRLLWIVGRMFGVVALASMVYSGHLYDFYNATGALKPNVYTGQIDQINNHGSYSYITRQQWRSIHYTEYGGLACMALGLAIEYIRQKKLKRRELYPTLQTGQAVGYPDWLRTHRAGGTANGSVAGRIKRWLEAEWPVIKPLAILLALFVLVSLILFSGR